MKRKVNRVLSLLLAIALCLGLLPCGSVLAAGDAMSLDRVKTLLNAEELRPQRTGYPELDGLLEQILKPCKDSDAYTKIKTMYDWTVDRVEYSWAGYSQDWAPAYDCFTLEYDLAYETGLPEAYPKDMINRAYHMLTARTGVCYDWAILFAVMARYVGLESYVHTGILRINDWTGHHGWTELRLGGVNYIFDAQQDNYRKESIGYNPHEHFGIAPASAGRWTQEKAVNDARDKSLLPLTADRTPRAVVTVETSRSGTVEGADAYEMGSEVTLSAQGAPVAGWYTVDGELLAQGDTYTFVLNGDARILTLFEGDLFVDVPAGVWYERDVYRAAEQKLLYGMEFAVFAPQGSMTRAMLAATLARLDGADTTASPAAPFGDVNQEAWYAGAVNWAYENQVVFGLTETRFDPAGKVTREQAAAMMVRFLEKKGIQGEGEKDPPEFTDAEQISPYARSAMEKAHDLGLIVGYEEGSVRPRQIITRAESALLLMRMSDCLAAA